MAARELSGAIKESNSVTEDLIVEILLRLRIKKVTRCKTVCKQWLRLISSPSFAFRHSQLRTFKRRRRPSFFIVSSLVTTGLMTPVSFSGRRKLKRHPHINLPHIKTCNDGTLNDGLVSYKVFSVGYGIYCLYELFSKTLLLWNPTTREHKVLPPSPSTGGFYFGTVDYKDGNFSYKIGRVTSRRSPNSTYTPDKGCHASISLELYSSKIETWKVRPDFASGQYFGYSDHVFHCANLNGRAHWVKQSVTEDTYITTFDYETEIFGKIKAPSPPQVCCSYNKLRCLVTLFDDKFLCLGLTQDIDDKWCYFDIWVMREDKFLCLGLTQDIDDKWCYFDIWMMREYGDEDSWTKELTVGPIPEDMEVLEFSSKLQGLFLRHGTHSPTELLFWDCKSSSTKSYCMTERRRLVRGSG